MYCVTSNSASIIFISFPSDVNTVPKSLAVIVAIGLITALLSEILFTFKVTFTSTSSPFWSSEANTLILLSYLFTVTFSFETSCET